jgi:RNA polymerase sigma-70 factor (sigma-E family)
VHQTHSRGASYVDFLRRDRDRTRIEFERFVASDGDCLLRTAYLITSDLPEAEDLVQECLLRVVRRWPKVRTMKHPSAYAQRILVNLALDGRHRRARRWQELLRVDGLSEAEQALRSDDRLAGMTTTWEVDGDLRDAVRALPTRQRVILVLRYFGDFSEAEVANTLGCSVGTVKSTTSRCLARLRGALESSATDGAPALQPPIGVETQLRSRSR